MLNYISKIWPLTIDINGDCPNDLVKGQLSSIAENTSPENQSITDDKLCSRVLPLWREIPGCPTAAVYFYYSDERLDYKSDEFLKDMLPRSGGELHVPLYVIVVRNFVAFPPKTSLQERCRLSLPKCRNVTYFLLNGHGDKLEDDDIQYIERDFKKNISPKYT
ncbi:hypothetical protein BC936DRAFT_139058 [Jimgerdemannia flammicorona]|uniref:Uncharacterized protein n=1 Tax=Jimgerdemannia flammicorona TaxID=994334 RepID=A0A433BAS7_9FUNG|nr:hypothetical protein BC936DRAFT_139058 [Jimgerdemannia flammicorona]